MGMFDFRSLEDHSFKTEWGTLDCYNHRASAYHLTLFPYFDAYLKKNGLIPSVQWPQGKRFCLALSHDVDNIGYYSLSEKLNMIKRSLSQARGLKKAGVVALIRSCLQWGRGAKNKVLSRTDPYHCFEKWLEIEDRYRAKSTFFFSTPVPLELQEIEDCAYLLEDYLQFDGEKIQVTDLMRQLNQRGWEVGLHPAIQTHKNLALLEQQKKMIDKILPQPIQSVRQHFLMFDPMTTPQIHSRAGFSFDSTYGFNKQVGFRAGTSFPFYFQDSTTLELPLIIQDVSMFRHLSAMGLGLTAAKELIGQIMQRVANVGGVMTVLWHPNTIAAVDPEYAEMYLKAYEFLLDLAQKEGAWITSVGEAGRYFKENLEPTVKTAFQDLDVKDLGKFVSCMTEPPFPNRL